MKRKKIYFIVSAIFQILLSFIFILRIDSIRKSSIESLSVFPDYIRDRMISIYSNDLIFIVPNVISIIIALIIIFIVFKKNIDYSRNSIFILNFISFISASSFLINIVSVINIIVAATIPAKSVRHEKLRIPTLDRVDTDSKSVKLAILCLVCYFFQIFIPDFNNFIFNLISVVLFYLISLSFCIYSFKANLKRDFIEFKKNIKAYLSFLIPRMLIMYVCYFALSFICMFILNNGIPINQQTLDSLPIWILIPLACFYAPIVEEIIFRGCLRRFIKKDIIYIIVSGLIFGLLHTVGEASLYSMVTMMIPYAFVGSFFSYIYVKTNNILSNVSCHCFHNCLAIIIQLIFM